MKTTTLHGILLFIIASLFINCSPKLAPKTKTEEPFYMFYPKPPDSAKLQYLTKFDSSKDFDKKQSSFKSKILGEEAALSIGKPYGVEIKNGKIYVCDLANRIVIIDLVNEKFNYFIPQGTGTLALPVNMYIDDEGHMYIVDIKAKVIKVYNAQGGYLGPMGMNELKKPTDVFVKHNKVYVCDSDNRRINIYDKNSRKLLKYFPNTEPDSEAWLYTPTNLFVSDTEVYVSDMGASTIKVYTLDGEFVRNVGTYGNRSGQFARTKGITVDNEGNLYVVDGAFQNVQIFNNEGQTLMGFGENNGLIGGMILPTSITVDYDNLEYFQKYVNPKYTLKYIIVLANQYGNKINIYGRIEPKIN
jgi:DNA-binding beta-propeller fold protein YncE